MNERNMIGIKKKVMLFGLIGICLLASVSCRKEERVVTEEAVDYFAIIDKPKDKWNALDSLCDTIYNDYGVKIIYEYTPRILDGTTFFVPPNYEKALAYVQVVVRGFWLKPLKEEFPEYFESETPREFVMVGGYVHFNDITVTGAAAGAGLNAQFYRLGMGGVNNFDKTSPYTLMQTMATLYHEHAHQQDHKYGRGYLYDRVSQGEYYGLNYGGKLTSQANADGFFMPYGGYAPEEDFATSVESMVLYDKATIESMAEANEKLKTKYEMVHAYYLEKGMDLHRLHEVVDSVIYKTTY
ncbi:substrate import-associated zinc metallohydrolase lipoprotein [Sphingobacterium sp. LRF_L2]|uniref:substrate import-associated zinc metallohydrolase lipoprotein n=1 Tax=Sphingobacterium sp. LRF_L2 TaxID=3369421 RepID=UPI003F5E5E28